MSNIIFGTAGRFIPNYGTLDHPWPLCSGNAAGFAGGIGSCNIDPDAGRTPNKLVWHLGSKSNCKRIK